MDQAGQGASARILVIDDEEVVHISLQRILGRQGHRIETTLSAVEGLEKLGGGSFDMVITDLMMPEMNGIELLTEMKRLRLEVPVIMITGYPTIKTALQALRLGAVDYLAKPFTRQELLAPVNRALRRQATGEQRVSVTPPPTVGGNTLEQQVIAPGERYHLRRHSWILTRQDGTLEVGVEESFLSAIGEVEQVSLPGEDELIEQGFVGIRLRTKGGEEHGVLMPVTARVLEVNRDRNEALREISTAGWLIRVLPLRLATELPLLVPG